MPPIKGENVSVTITREGQPIAVLNGVSYEVTDAGELVKKNYLGENRPREVRIENGWTGRVTYEIEDAELDDLLDQQTALADANSENAVFGLQIAEVYPNGQTRRYSYYPATIKISQSMGGRTDMLTKTFEFSAADRKKVA